MQLIVINFFYSKNYLIIYIQSNILVDIVKCPVSPDLKMWGHHDLSTSLVLIV